MQLEKKTAIVTGGGSGFGAGIADLFSKNGATVIVADINIENATKVANHIGGIPVQVDVSDAESVKAMKTTLIKENEKIDILINNAGTTHLPAPMETISEREFDKVFSIL